MFKTASCSSILGVILLVLIVGVGWFPSVAMAEPVLTWRAIEHRWPPDNPWHVHQIEVTITGLSSQLDLVGANIQWNGFNPVSYGMNDNDGWFEEPGGTWKLVTTFGWDSDVYDVQNVPEGYFDILLTLGDFNWDTFTWDNVRDIGSHQDMGNYLFNAYGGYQYPVPGGDDSAVDVLISLAGLGGVGLVVDGIWAIIITMCCVVAGYTIIRNRLNNFKRGVK